VNVEGVDLTPLPPLPQRVVMIEFPSLADAERWRSSPEFQKLKPLQQQSSKYIESFAIEGVQ
jgi:uncharacterized protein (DUF1330 family)